MTAAIITLTTDFGADSPYVAALKAAILAINPHAVIVDITHSIKPQQIRPAARVLEDITPAFPAGTIHVAVVDPGVGTARAIVYARLDAQHYVCPDNGLLTRVCRRRRPDELRRLTRSEHWAPRVSATFHGRDIMAPVAARLSLGLPPDQLGPAQDRLVELDWEEARAMPGKVTGRVESIDSFGNLITDITSEQVGPCRGLGEQVRIECDEHETFGIWNTYGDVPERTFVAIIGSSDRLELAVTGESAAALLRIREGTRVTVSW